MIGIRDDALQALESYRWPGNIRELRNVVERVIALSAGPEVQLSDLPESIRMNVGEPAVLSLHAAEPIAPTSGRPAGSLNQAKEEAEIRRIMQALKKHGNNRLRGRGAGHQPHGALQEAPPLRTHPEFSGSQRLLGRRSRRAVLRFRSVEIPLWPRRAATRTTVNLRCHSSAIL